MRLSIVSTIFLLALLITGCNVKRKAVRYMNEHPNVLAELCSDKYPVKETIIQGKPIHHYTTTTIKGDSIPCPQVEGKNGKFYAPKVKCPDQTIVHDSVTVTDTIYQENTAKLAVLTNDISKANTTIDTLKKQEQAAEKRFVWSVIVGLCLLIASRTFKF